jgi:flagellar biosynthesis protein FlhB
MFYTKSKRELLDLFAEKRESLVFQTKISNLLMEAVKESEKKEHKNTNNSDIVSIIGFGIYSIVLPIVVLISLANVIVDAFNTRYCLFEQ